MKKTNLIEALAAFLLLGDCEIATALTAARKGPR